MKRKRTVKAQKSKMPLAKTTLQNAAQVAENDTINDKTEVPETSTRFLPNERTEENTTPIHMESSMARTGNIMRSRQTDLETDKSYPVALGEMIATIIKEISKDAGGFANLTKSLAGNPVSNAQGQSRVDMGFEENESRLHQNRDNNQQELNAALTVIKKTMKLDACEPFNRPVDPVALNIPDYFDVIKTPMDFGTICNNLENGVKYMNSADVFKDVEYIWFNCYKYNKKGDYILELMNRVKTFFMRYWTAAGLQTEQSPPNFVESSISRHNNQEKNYQLAPLANNVTHPQQNEAGSNQVMENQPTPVNMRQPSQPQQTSSPLPQSPSSQEDEPNIDSMITPKKRHVRGYTRCAKLLDTKEKITIRTNELGEPVGPEASKLTSFLGLTARDGNLAPLTYPSWHKVPKENKESMWQKVLTKFEIDPSSRSWVLESLRTKWRNFKSQLKVAHFDTHDNDADRLADRDERVLPDQWAFLVSQWGSEKWQNLSAKNKANRAKLKFRHTTGTKSFARLREEERLKRLDGQEPSRAELFIMTRTKKDGQPVDEETAAIISQLRESTTQNGETSNNIIKSQDDVFNRIMGIEKKDSMSLLKSTRSEALRMVAEKNEEVLEMKERLSLMEKTCSQMAAQMSQMVSMMSTIQKHSPAENAPSAVVDNLVPIEVDVPHQTQPTSASNHEAPAKKTRGRKKKR